MEYVPNSKIAEWYGPPCTQAVVRVRIAGSKVSVARKARRLFRWQERVFQKYPRLYRDLTEKHLDDWGGLCRKIAGTDTWSKHAWWIADDIDADENVQGTPPKQSEIWVKGGNGKCVRLLEASGFTWGGWFSFPDPHHFEVAVSPKWIRQRFTRRGKPKRWFRRKLREDGFPV